VGRVFDAFEQADSQSEGLGLGLAISKAIVEMHAGTIRARSEGPGKGATFVIDLPVRTLSQ
jgi:signal transduction histidine kinase